MSGSESISAGDDVHLPGGRKIACGWLIWLIPFILSIIGIVMISSISLKNSMSGGEPYTLPIRQMQFLGIGVFFALLLFLHPHFRIKKLRSSAGRMWLFSLLLMFAPLIPGLGVRAGGAQRWIQLMGMRFQPIELMMFVFPLFYADRLNYKERGSGKVFMSTLLLLGLTAFPLVMQSTLGGIMLVSSVCMIMLWDKRGISYLIPFAILAVILAVPFVYYVPYRMRRIIAFVDPWADKDDIGYQAIQGLIAFSNGGLSGVGIGKGLQNLPEAQTDYIFPSIGEEFGLIATLGILMMYAVWTFRVFRTYRMTRDPFLASLTLGLAASIICPMFLNLAGVTKIIPMTGMPMPFLSSGGSSMVCMWLKVAVLCAVDAEVQRTDDGGGINYGDDAD